MLDFKPINIKSAARLRKYYSQCTYRLAEYSLGVKLMWRDYWHSQWAETNGCLIVLNQTKDHGPAFDFPIPLPGVGDVDAALDAIDAWCMAHGVAPTFSAIPEEEKVALVDRYPYTRVDTGRVWQDYLYRSEDLSTFAGRRYSGQRNHINKFRKLYPNARFRPIGPEDRDKVEEFWAEFHRNFNKETSIAKRELCAAHKLSRQIGKRWLKAGAIELDGKFISIALGEICGSTMICHVEKSLPQYEGVYPTMVQAFASQFAADMVWINREDDACDRGLRTSKLQYLPADMGKKSLISTRNELAMLNEIPKLESQRLTLDEICKADIPVYNRLCLDDERNKWWGYDYKKDLKGELTENYFYKVARHDYKHRLAINFAIRLDGQMIGEAVLYNFDYKGAAELGCRILPEFAGQGYGAEAFRTVAEWSLYQLGLYRLVAKCYHENEASRKMLSSCMRPSGQDEIFYYYEKVV